MGSGTGNSGVTLKCYVGRNTGKIMGYFGEIDWALTGETGGENTGLGTGMRNKQGSTGVTGLISQSGGEQPTDGAPRGGEYEVRTGLKRGGALGWGYVITGHGAIHSLRQSQSGNREILVRREHTGNIGYQRAWDVKMATIAGGRVDEYTGRRRDVRILFLILQIRLPRTNEKTIFGVKKKVK